MKRVYISFVLAALGGCASSQEKAPLLAHRTQMQFNTGQKIRVVGTAHYSRVTGPSVVGEDFELRVFPTSAWDAQNEGKKIEVTGTIHDSVQKTPPDPSVVPGEYWLDGTTWQPADLEKKQ